MSTTAIKTEQILRISANRIHVLPEFQVRNTQVPQEEIEALAASIVANGQDTPVIAFTMSTGDFKKAYPNEPVFEGEKQYVLFAGFTRMAAINLALAKGDLPEAFRVRVDVRYNGIPSKQQLFIDSARENMARNAMNKVDIARVVAQMIKWGFAQKDIASKLGITQAEVSNLAAFDSNADLATKEAVATGEVSFSAATAAVKAGITGEGLKEIVAESNATGAKVTADVVRAKATGQLSPIQTLKTIIKAVERGDMVIKGNGKQYSSNEMFVLFWDIVQGEMESKELFNIFNPENVVKETKAPKGQLVPQNAPNGAVGFEADDSDREEE